MVRADLVLLTLPFAVLREIDYRRASFDSLASVVEFVVWTSRPTGYVDNETARWLVTALMSMDRATVNAHRAALEIVREAQQVGEELLPLLLPRAGRDLAVS